MFNIKNVFLYFLSLFLMQAEISLIALDNNKKLPVILKNKDFSLIYIFRNGDFFANNISFSVYLNNPEDSNMLIGETKGKEYIYIFLKKGNYTIYSKADNMDKLNINVVNGNTYFIKQISLPGYNAFNKLELVDYKTGYSYIEKSKPGIIKKEYIN